MGKIVLTLKDCIDQRGITRYALRQMTGIHYDTLDSYYKNRVIRYDGYVLAKICEALGCSVGDILQYQAEDTEESS